MRRVREVSKKKTKEQHKAYEVNFSPGDTVKVHVKIPEDEGKFRIQTFEGAVIRKRSAGISSTFTVRRISHGEGVERVFPLHSPMIDSLDVLRKGKVRRAKLYYLRGRTGKSAKIAEKKAKNSVK
ncbi:MAG: 50S ribosomal protein L19 [PVC group bacterium]|nr:50S ribosomal protein L19 [PVC group bacterium]